MLRVEAVDFILKTEGRIFGVEFMMRTTGETRRMQARLGVTSHLKGGPKAYDAEAHGLITVFDMSPSKRAYRCIPIEGITNIEIKKVWHQVN